MSASFQGNKTVSVRPRVVHWFAELLLVFLGVYGAFWLNGFQERQHAAQRHDRILATLEESVQKSAKRYEIAAEQQDRVAADFRRRLDSGEMPPLSPFFFSSGYSASDAATLLQSGGLDLLDATTISALRNAESVARTGNSEMQQIQTLSNELIAPNLDQDISFFYDPATKHLRKRFASYPDALQAATDFLHNLAAAYQQLLERLHAERQRR
ncbi:MAG TPA: hypothetical protein VE031_11115 [Chthoniobacterales bacterium]|nr:hypothetical protein [Chthoniobacterales bacterium]